MIVQEIKRIDSKKSKIYTDCDYNFSLYNTEIYKYNIKEGCDIENIIESINKVLYKRGINYVINVLKNSDKTEQNLVMKLKQYNYPQMIIDEIILKIKNMGYVDDENFAREYISSHIDNKSINYIKNKLYEKGVSSKIIENIIQEFDVGSIRDVEREQIENIILKKMQNIRKKISIIDDNDESKNIKIKEIKKLMMSLLRKGYKYNDVIDLIKKNCS